MRKASAITLSIFIMMIMLAVLLGYTAYYVDQVMIRPVVLMKDAEVGLRCYFVLTNIISGEYLREGETPPEGSLRSKLLETYQVVNEQGFYLGEDQDTYQESLNLMYGGADIIIKNEAVFRQILNNRVSANCLMRIYGPIRTGYAGLFVEDENIERAYEQALYWQCKLYGETLTNDKGAVCVDRNLRKYDNNGVLIPYD